MSDKRKSGDRQSDSAGQSAHNTERRTHHDCLNCKHNFFPFTKRWQPGLHCEAFPNGILWEIFDRRVDHTTPYPGDNGIVFEAMTTEDRVQLRREQQECKEALRCAEVTSTVGAINQSGAQSGAQSGDEVVSRDHKGNPLVVRVRDENGKPKLVPARNPVADAHYAELEQLEAEQLEATANSA